MTTKRTATATLNGITREVEIDPFNVREHMSASLNEQQAIKIEAIVTLGALLVEEEIAAHGIVAGEALAITLEESTADACFKICGL